MFDTPYEGLMKWYVSQMEKFGWMIVLSQNETDNVHKENKLNVYIDSLNELKKCIEYKIKTLNDEDKKNDLLIIHKRLIKFIPSASNILKNDIKGGKKKSKK